jgi:hypothetical protein
MSIQEDEDIPNEDDDIPEDDSSIAAPLVTVAIPQAQAPKPKQIGYKPKRKIGFKPKKQRSFKPKGRPKGKNSCIIPMRISQELHDWLKSEKGIKETFDQCALRLIKESLRLRIEIDRLKQNKN